MKKSLGRTWRAFAAAACVAACAASAAAVQGGAQSAGVRGGVTVFRGTLGEAGKIRIQMRLRREGDKLSGAYFYESIGKDLALRGTIDAAGNFTLQEFDAAGAQTGLLKGTWHGPQCEDCTDSLQGRWSRPDGTRQLPFTLSVYPVSFADDTRLVSKSLKESNRRGKWGGYEISAEYPQLQGAAAGAAGFNREVASLIAKEVADYKKMFTADRETGGELDLSYYVARADDRLVSVNFSQYFYYFGAGQRNAVSRSFNYDLARGRVLKLTDLFKPSTDYLKVISDVCNSELRKQFKGESFPDAERIAGSVENVLGDERKWLVGEAGLIIVFDSTEFGPPGSGETTVVVPYAALKGLVRPDGPLATLPK